MMILEQAINCLPNDQLSLTGQEFVALDFLNEIEWFDVYQEKVRLDEQFL